MKIVKLLSVALILLLVTFQSVSANDFNYQVAAKCKGEASFSIEGCACTVKNRLLSGWAQSKVLRAYYAPSRTPTQAEVDLVESVLSGKIECDEDKYFMFSLQDTRYLGISHMEPIEKVVYSEGRLEIWYFEKWYKYRPEYR